MLKSKEMPVRFWGEAVKTAVYILNIPIRSIENSTPYQLWFERIPKVQYMRVFGCIAHAKKLTPHPPKLANRNLKTILLGREEESKAYRLLDPLENKIILSPDVVFEEDKG